MSTPYFREDLKMVDGDIELDARSAVELNGAKLDQHIAVPSKGPLLLRWEFEIDQPGRYEIWAHYFSNDTRPIRIEINDDTVSDYGLSESTFGTRPKNLMWAYQVSTELVSGRNCLKMTSPASGPHLKALRLRPSSREAPQDVAQRRPRPGHQVSKSLDDRERAEMFRILAPFVRKQLARKVSAKDMKETLANLVQGIETDLGSPQKRIGFSGPMNGQVLRQSLFLGLDNLFNFDVFIETGSFLGTTTEMLAQYIRPVFSCELNKDFYYRAAARLAFLENVLLYNMDSRSFLRSFAAEDGANFSMPFIYLDAHWNDDLPLPSEIEIIAAHYSEYVIMVDDFKHPFFNYGYDQYTSGIELTLEYLRPRIKEAGDLRFLFPAYPPHVETGARRGTLIIVPSAVADRITKAGLPVISVS